MPYNRFNTESNLYRDTLRPIFVLYPAGIDLSAVGPLRRRVCAQLAFVCSLEDGRHVLELSGRPGERSSHLQANFAWATNCAPRRRCGPVEHEDHLARNCLRQSRPPAVLAANCSGTVASACARTGEPLEYWHRLGWHPGH